ncbi:MAG TPA: phosphoribosylglycinamide formyltransferase [Paludibacter sp.]|nr:phosphoribosylglycinamide formyltransferase [Paludibacter sp.]
MSYRIAILASGSGSNAENIIKYFSHSEQFIFPLIISNKPDAFVHKRAENLKIPSITFTREEFSEGAKVIEILKENKIDCIVLAGFLLKISTNIIEKFPDRIINIHPALLPKFGGKGMYGDKVHQAVVDAHETESGITVHFVNEKYDEGNIIFQAKCPVTADDTAETVAHKVHALEYEHFPKVIERIWGK